MKNNSHDERLVSVIMPAFNAESTIYDSINSVRCQTYKNWELIFIDDHSTDKTLSIAKTISKIDDRIKIYQNQRTKGAAGARNTALKYAKGQYFAFLDSDDLWMPNKLEIQIQAMGLEKSVFCYSGYYLFDNQNLLIFKEVVARQIINSKDILYGNPFGCLTVIFHRKILQSPLFPELVWADGYFEKYIGRKVGHEDYCAWISIILKNEGIKFTKIPFPTALYRVSKNSLSGNKLKSAVKYWLIYRKFLKINFFNSIWYSLAALINRYRSHKGIKSPLLISHLLSSAER